MEKVSLLLPTRGRPALAMRFLQSALAHAANPEYVEAILSVDDDDTASHHISCPPLTTKVIVGPRATMGSLNTRCLRESSGDIVILSNDDIVIATDGWDEKVRALHRSIPDRVYLAYPNDLFKGKRLCTFPILSRKTCDLLGDPFPASYKGAFIDYHLLDIFERVKKTVDNRIFYLEDVVFEHLHYRTGKSDFDDTYRSRNRFDDDEVFLRLASSRAEGAWNLVAAIRSPTSNVSAKEGSVGEPRPVGFFHATLLDDGLPLIWRWRLFVWFMLRKLAATVLADSKASAKGDA